MAGADLMINGLGDALAVRSLPAIPNRPALGLVQVKYSSTASANMIVSARVHRRALGRDRRHRNLALYLAIPPFRRKCFGRE
jgi:hypothetical protein